MFSVDCFWFLWYLNVFFVRWFLWLVVCCFFGGWRLLVVFDFLGWVSFFLRFMGVSRMEQRVGAAKGYYFFCDSFFLWEELDGANLFFGVVFPIGVISFFFWGGVKKFDFCCLQKGWKSATIFLNMFFWVVLGGGAGFWEGCGWQWTPWPWYVVDTFVWCVDVVSYSFHI